jgi:polysaccharide biosynthesis transport protein
MLAKQFVSSKYHLPLARRQGTRHRLCFPKDATRQHPPFDAHTLSQEIQMSHNKALTPAEVLRILRDYPRRWIVPTVILTMLAASYAMLHAPMWDASQAMMVRDEAMGAAARPGKFQQPDDMKTTQETILELARSRTVLSAALKEVGSDSKADAAAFPNDFAIAALQGKVKLVPPKGAEFGKTEVFYLNVEAESRPRAVALASAICQQTQLRSQELRDQKAQSLITELTKTADLAHSALNSTTGQLTKIESSVGADLGELRLLNDVGGGDSPLRRSINEMDQELRQARQAIDANNELLTLLETSKTDAHALAAAPNRLLEAQPVLRRLKDGLVDAQLHTAQLSGNLTANHPSVIAAKVSEQEIADEVRDEIDSSIVGVQAELRLSQARADVLETQLNDARQRLAKLADMRAQYANLVAERNQRADILKTAEQQLAEAHASQASARTASLITVIDSPVPGDAPVGPGKATIVGGGFIAGFILGLGILFLTVNPSQLSQMESEGQTIFHELPEQVQSINPAAEVAFPAVRRTGFNGFSSNVPATNGHDVFAGSLSFKQALHKLAAAR